MTKTTNSILLIYTGGTIGMINQPETNSLVPVDFSEISNQLPELNRFSFRITSHTFKPSIDSSNADPVFWKELAEVIHGNYYNYDGFVVLHGTDTMAYSASALSFMFENLDKPVVFTGSQLPIGVLRTDGKENLLSALEIAADRKDGQPIVPEVCIFFQNKLFRGNRTSKHNAEYFNAFRSDNYPALAETGISIHYNHAAIHQPVNKRPLSIHTNMNRHVGILKLFPGISPQWLQSLLESPGLQGLVLESFGTGNAPIYPWFIDAIKKAIDRGLIIVNVTQCQAGKVHPDKYETSRLLHKTGVVNGQDMTTEAAITKLMFLLGKGLQNQEVSIYLNRSLSGEISL